MKRVIYFASAAVLLVAATAYSQQPPQPARRSASRPACSAATPASRRTSPRPPRRCPRPTTASSPARRLKRGPTAQVIAHIAQAQFGQCSGLNGVPNPMAGKNLEQELKTKAEVTKALADSFALCDERVRRRHRRERDRDGQGRDRTKLTRAAALYGVHRARQRDGRHRRYVYLRSKNIVPPSTERAQAAERGQ